MGLPVKHMCCSVLLLFVSVSTAAPVSDTLTVLTKTSVSVRHGHTTTLPCWINPPQSAEGMEVRWYRGDRYDSPIILYKAQKVVASQEASYKDRASLVDAESGGLKTGVVSLELVNVTTQDAGDYTCYVSSDQGYDSEIVHLSVTEAGTTPFLSVKWKETGLVNVSCESAGWYPQPALRWSNHAQDLPTKSVQYGHSSSGLVSVHSWVLVPTSSEVSCSVGHSEGELKVANVRLENLSPPAKEPGSSVPGWVAFAIVLILLLALLGLLYFKRRALFSGKKDKLQGDQVDANELTEPLLNEAIDHYVNVSLDKVKHKYLLIKDCKLRDKSGSLPDGQKVTCLTAIKGTPGFSSGKHYWEVSLGKPETGVKESWWLGVTNAADLPTQFKVPLTPSKGFWFLSSSPDSFQFSTEPNVSLPSSVISRPQTVGVYLNYDSGELSFYDVEHKSLIGSLTGKFRGEVFPFFNPGKDDKSPMEILHKPVQGESSKVVNMSLQHADMAEKAE